MPAEVIRLEKHPGDKPELYVASRGGTPLGTIAMPARSHISIGTVMSLLATDIRFAIEQERTVPIKIIHGNVLPWQRNELINQMEGDWILFIDDDMTWPPDAIARLVATREEHDLDMVGGLCFRRAHPFQPTLYMREKPDDGLYKFLERWEYGEVVEVDATGMAFMLIHKRVFEKIADGPMPTYDERRAMGGPPPVFFHWYGTLGEDLLFCQQAKAAGVKIFVDTSIEIGHMAEVNVTHEDFLAAMATRPPQVVTEVRKINDQLGLPTMEPDEAKERLGWR